MYDPLPSFSQSLAWSQQARDNIVLTLEEYPHLYAGPKEQLLEHIDQAVEALFKGKGLTLHLPAEPGIASVLMYYLSFIIGNSNAASKTAWEELEATD
jgi:hypothetical protein